MNNQIIKSNYICNLFFGITTFCTVISSTNFVSAQIIPDNTLPNNSEVGIEGNITKIEGGTTNGGNLFHSFEKFGINTGGEAHFDNAVDISNIITRVTGNSISDIDGLIKANGTANLFLINPNGIVFGENARLDIGGSFLGSTADSFKFGNDIEFSAVNPDTKPLLTMNVPMGLQYGMNPGQIQVKGDGEGVGESSEIADTQNGLQVKPNQTLALIGGDINLEGATLKSYVGKVELGSVAAPGLVNIAPVEKGFSFNYHDVDGGNIELSKQTTVDASGEGAGDIRVWGRNIKITDGSLIETSTLGSEDGGSLVVNGQESVQIIGTNGGKFTGLFTGVSSQATRKGADIAIKTNSLLVKDGAEVGSRTFGKGNGGSLIVNAQDVQLIGDSTSLFASAEENSTGNAGDIAIQTNNLLVKDGVIIAADTSGKGNGGDLTIKTNTLLAKDRALINVDTDGEGNGGNLSIDAQDIQITSDSLLFTSSDENSTGDAGDLTIQTDNLLVKDGAGIGNLLESEKGNGGNLSIDAQDVQLIGSLSGLSLFEGENSTGIKGDITIKTNTLLVKDGASIYNTTSGKGKGGNLSIDAQDVQLIGSLSGLSTFTMPNSDGNAGNITIKTNNLLFKDEATIFTTTFGKGNGGNLSIDAQDVQLIGDSSLSSFTDSIGDAGDITVKTDTLTIKDGSDITTDTLAQGNAGNLSIDAQDVQLIGETKNGQFSSNLSAEAALNSTGDAGNLTINTNDLLVKDGAQITVGTFGQGKGGNLNVDATNVQLIGKTKDNQFSSGLFTSATENSTGDAGNLTINADILQVENGAKVDVEGRSTGKTGNLNINADSIRLNNDGLLSANTGNNTNSDTEQATININSQDLIMRRGSNIFTNATGENVIGGNINIDTDFLIANENSDISANSENSQGGKVRIDAQAIFGTQFRPELTPQSDITATGATSDLSGTVEIITPQTDPTSGSIQFPTIPVETEVADACSTPGYAQSSFTITGKGSLPPSPFEPLTGRLNQTKLATLEENEEIKSQARATRRISKKQPDQIKPIVEARGWVRTKDGRIILVANAPKAMSSSGSIVSKSCSVKQLSINN